MVDLPEGVEPAEEFADRYVKNYRNLVLREYTLGISLLQNLVAKTVKEIVDASGVPFKRVNQVNVNLDSSSQYFTYAPVRPLDFDTREKLWKGYFIKNSEWKGSLEPNFGGIGVKFKRLSVPNFVGKVAFHFLKTRVIDSGSEDPLYDFYCGLTTKKPTFGFTLNQQDIIRNLLEFTGDIPKEDRYIISSTYDFEYVSKNLGMSPVNPNLSNNLIYYYIGVKYSFITPDVKKRDLIHTEYTRSVNQRLNDFDDALIQETRRIREQIMSRFDHIG